VEDDAGEELPVIFSEGAVAGAFAVELELRRDARGWFARSWCAREFAQHGLLARIAQVNTQWSPQVGTLRGLHWQEPPHAEVKLVRCTRGAVYDVIVDLRPGSPTFRRSMACELTPDNGLMLYAPEGCAHGYLTLKEDTEVTYFTSEFYAPEAARGIRFDDPAFDIRWPAAVRVVSNQDRQWPDYLASRGDPR
jgi:dTDP-4-dehydrorhamnose 3,5-epimerase